VLSAFLSWLEHDGKVERNVAKGVRRQPESHRQVFLDADGIKAAHKALAADPNRAAALALRLALLTGCRTGPRGIRDALIAFAQGGELPVEILQKLATEVTNGHARFDAERDLLCPVHTEVKALGTPPAQLDPGQVSYPEPAGGWSRGGLGELPPSPQTPASGKWPGWA
jgi:hypothetical protein